MVGHGPRAPGVAAAARPSSPTLDLLTPCGGIGGVSDRCRSAWSTGRASSAATCSASNWPAPPATSRSSAARERQVDRAAHADAARWRPPTTPAECSSTASTSAAARCRRCAAAARRLGGRPADVDLSAAPSPRSNRLYGAGGAVPPTRHRLDRRLPPAPSSRRPGPPTTRTATCSWSSTAGHPAPGLRQP